MSVEITKDLRELCALLHTRNELQAKRHWARKRALRIAQAISFRQDDSKRKDLERKANMNIEGKIAELPAWAHRDYAVRVQAQNTLRQDKERAAADLAKMGNRPYRSASAKLCRTKTSELQCMLLEAKVADMQAKLDLRRHTQANSKRWRELIKRNNWVIEMDNTNGRYVGVRTKGNWEKPGMAGASRHEVMPHQIRVTGRDEIAHIAAGQLLEVAIAQS